jgi:hypothetical protein
MVMMVNIVMIEVDIVGMLVFATGEMDLLTVLDMILKAVVIDDVVFQLSSVVLPLSSVRGLL